MKNSKYISSVNKYPKNIIKIEVKRSIKPNNIVLRHLNPSISFNETKVLSVKNT